MSIPTRVSGNAIFVQTNSPLFTEEARPFSTLEEMVEVCCAPPLDCSLDKVIVTAVKDDRSCSVTLEFVSATRGEAPGAPVRPRARE